MLRKNSSVLWIQTACVCLLAFALAGCRRNDDAATDNTMDQQPGSALGEKSNDNSPVVVKVNGHCLTERQLQNSVNMRLKLEGAFRLPPDKLAQRRHACTEQTIDSFIGNVVFMKEADRLNITITEHDVDKAIVEIRARLPKDTSWELWLKARNKTEAKLRDDLKKDPTERILKLLKMQTSHIRNATDREISDFYAKERDLFRIPANLVVRHLLVNCPSGTEDKIADEKKRLAADYRKQLLKGADFAELARKHSECAQTKLSGGMFPMKITRQRPVLPKRILEAAFELRVKKISSVLKSELGYHVVQVLEHNKKSIRPLDDVRASIANHINAKLREPAVNEYKQQLRSKATIEYPEGRSPARADIGSPLQK